MDVRQYDCMHVCMLASLYVCVYVRLVGCLSDSQPDCLYINQILVSWCSSECVHAFKTGIAVWSSAIADSRTAVCRLVFPLDACNCWCCRTPVYAELCVCVHGCCNEWLSQSECLIMVRRAGASSYVPALYGWCALHVFVAMMHYPGVVGMRIMCGYGCASA